MKFSNGLTDAQAERLAYLAEECAEAIQAVGKILRHGYESCDPTRPAMPSNRRLLENELADVRWAIQLLTTSGDLSEATIWSELTHRDRDQYFHHQEEGEAR